MKRDLHLFAAPLFALLMEALAGAAAAAEPMAVNGEAALHPDDAARPPVESDEEEGPEENDDEDDARPPGGGAPEEAATGMDVDGDEPGLTSAPALPTSIDTLKVEELKVHLWWRKQLTSGKKDRNRRRDCRAHARRVRVAAR